MGDTWCIQELFLSCLSLKYDSKKFKKIVIELVTKSELSNKIQDMVDVISITKTLDFENYFQCSNYEKKKILLDILQEGITTICESEGWELAPLLKAYQCCLDKKLEYSWLRKDKYFLSPNRKYYAGIYCNWDIDKFEAFAVFLDKEKREIKRVKLFEVEPHQVDPMGKMEWSKDSTHFRLYSKNESNKWEAALDQADG